MEQKNSSTLIERRKFLNIIFNFSLFTWLAAVLYPVVKYLIPPTVQEVSVNSITAGTIQDFPINSSKIIRFGRKPIIVIRKTNGGFRALSATCTHLDCNVQYKSDTEQIWCACHNGFYDIEGKNISGPPPRPLMQYRVNISEDNVIVSKGELS
ncbi:MAG: Rieske 2Fe-2S domain-containing protein [Planctomycetia bacterium]|nr:Rieske 2Fe-2S domain-containing protein [Planctomycetia bacterium]